MTPDERAAIRALLAELPRCQYGYGRCAAPVTHTLPPIEAGCYCDAHAPDGYDEMKWAPALRAVLALVEVVACACGDGWQGLLRRRGIDPDGWRERWHEDGSLTLVPPCRATGRCGNG